MGAWEARARPVQGAADGADQVLGLTITARKWASAEKKHEAWPLVVCSTWGSP